MTSASGAMPLSRRLPSRSEPPVTTLEPSLFLQTQGGEGALVSMFARSLGDSSAGAVQATGRIRVRRSEGSRSKHSRDAANPQLIEAMIGRC